MTETMCVYDLTGWAKAEQGQGKVSSKQHPSDAGRRRVVVDGWTGFNGGDPTSTKYVY